MRTMKVVAAILAAGCVAAAAGSTNESQKAPQIPDSIKAKNTVNELREELMGKDAHLRQSAVQRVGETGGPEAIPALLEVFANERSMRGWDYVPAVKIEVVQALGRIGTEAALKTVRSILDNYLKEGGRDHLSQSWDAECIVLARVAIRVLGEKALGETTKQIKDLSNEANLPWEIRQEAVRWCLEDEMRSAHKLEMNARIEWLVARLTGSGEGHKSDWVQGQSGMKTPEALRNSAIVDMLIECGDKTVEPLKRQLELLKPTQEEGPNSKDRREAIEYVLRRVTR